MSCRIAESIMDYPVKSISGKSIAMIAKDILKADMLDILFEHRNKKYGAYVLRKNYNGRLLLSLSITLLIAGIIFSLLSYSRIPEMVLARDVKIPPVEPENLIKPPQQIIPPEPQMAAPAPRPPMAPSMIPVIVPDRIPIERPVLENSLLEGRIPGPELRAGDPGGDRYINSTDGARAGDKGPGNEAETEEIKIWSTAEIMPEFPGGMEAWQRFLRRHLHAPSELQPGDKITVRVRFIVGPEGTVSGFQFVESGGYSFDNEVLRVLKKMPQWKPGENNGHKVAVYFVQPITFVAAEE